MKRFSTLFLALFVCVIGFQRAAAAQAPTTARAGDGVAPRPGMFLDRIRESLDDLKLSDEQKQKIGGILDKGRDDFRGMMQELRQADPQARREKLRDLMTGLH